MDQPINFGGDPDQKLIGFRNGDQVLTRIQKCFTAFSSMRLVAFVVQILLILICHSKRKSCISINHNAYTQESVNSSSRTDSHFTV